MKILLKWINSFVYSLPIQLFILSIKKNQLLLIFWLLLIFIVTENFGSAVGLPTLFLEPEYLDQVNFWSFFIVGITLGIFTLSYQITSYILDSQKFSFLGALSRPFTKFLVNNSIIPFLFTGIYLVYLVRYQLAQNISSQEMWMRFSGLVIGFAGAATLVFIYAVSTNQDFFKLFAKQLNKSLNRTRVVRVNVIERFRETKRSNVKVKFYLNNLFIPTKIDTEKNSISYRRQERIFNQNFRNGVIIQFLILTLVFVVGAFRDNQFFQIPAGASLVLLFTIAIMVIGALSYWLRGWTVTITFCLLLLLNFLMEEGYLLTDYEAYGLNYNTTKAPYNLRTIKQKSNDRNYSEDVAITKIALENWRKKFSQKPKMVFICASGGGLRASVWTMRTLQIVDSTLNGRLMEHTMLMSGASGGLIGAGYFRELYLRDKLSGGEIDVYDPKYLDNIAKDNLNALMFSLVVNDLFFMKGKFKYENQEYHKDRGYAFEEQLNKNTDFILDKPLCDYKEPELLAQIPMMILAPTIMNDGRKLFISPLNVSYMTVPSIYERRFLNQKAKGIEFLRFFEQQGSSNLRFLTALRMSASFPYITPNVKLSSEPAMEIIDAGLSDNFGVDNAVRFLYVFKDWIAKNTSGVIFVSIRDTQKDKPIETSLEQSFFQRLTTPLGSVLYNWEYSQDIHNDNLVEFARSWFKGPINRIEFQYVPISKSLKEIKEKEARRKQGIRNKNPYKIIITERAPLSLRLTQKQKNNIKRTIWELRNQSSLRRLQYLLRQ